MEKWGLGTIARPADQHGTYSFYLEKWRAGASHKVNANAYRTTR